MVGLATAQDLLLLFVFWDLTAIASYLLIGFDRQHREARLSALMALLVTGVSAVLLLIGILVLRAEYGTTSIPELLARRRRPGRPGGDPGRRPDRRRGAGQERPGAAALLAAAGDGRPDAGVGLPALGGDGRRRGVPAQPPAPAARVQPGPARRAAGGRAGVDGRRGPARALGADHLKRLLAYSTIAQYGYVVTMLGVGGAAGAAAACFYVLAHALAKSALFMTSGRGHRGHRRPSACPRSAAWPGPCPSWRPAAALAAAGLAALPLTIGFFKDELFFKAAAERGPWLAVAGGRQRRPDLRLRHPLLDRDLPRPARAAGPRRCPGRLVAPVVVPGRAGGRRRRRGRAVRRPRPGRRRGHGRRRRSPSTPAYHLDLRAENVMALATYAARRAPARRAPALAAALAAVGAAGRAWPGRSAPTSPAWPALNRLSNAIHDIEVRDLRARVVAVLVPAGVLVGAGSR